MKWIFRSGAAVAMLGMAASAQAGLLGGLFSSHGGNGCCEESCCPEGCGPVVARPCEQTYTYQRKCSDLRPPCCDEDCCDEGCCEEGCREEGCTAPCDSACGNGSCLSHGRKKGCGLLSRLFGGKKRGHGCLDHGVDCCETGCGNECGPPMECGNPCEIAKLIYQAQTACYAKDRKEAVDELGEFDCRCHPEIMVALVYSLNDCDEDVRAEAADSIGDLIEDGRCCCSPEVVAALTCALGDCDDDVRDQAEEALELCGYEVVEGCCQNGCCETACADTASGQVGGHTVPVAPAQAAPVPGTAAPAPVAPAPAPAAPMKKEATPAPAPPQDPEAYFPSRFRQQTSRTGTLTNLFGLAN